MAYYQDKDFIVYFLVEGLSVKQSARIRASSANTARQLVKRQYPNIKTITDCREE